MNVINEDDVVLSLLGQDYPFINESFATFAPKITKEYAVKLYNSLVGALAKGNIKLIEKVAAPFAKLKTTSIDIENALKKKYSKNFSVIYGRAYGEIERTNNIGMEEEDKRYLALAITAAALSESEPETMVLRISKNIVKSVKNETEKQKKKMPKEYYKDFSMGLGILTIIALVLRQLILYFTVYPYLGIIGIVIIFGYCVHKIMKRKSVDTGETTINI